ncbi:hypothetical protein SCHPADRAFT_419922 [Schizopora paradoxa]|uniref:Uncharacterized protein n=1 Tax=Schizopora paradoxa TaxID=27342 RepID=A0A0H2RKQ8_9AGAM|nr:hypothetical protein SCHPADRAFT_419922 [Schizopora paradoxa]
MRKMSIATILSSFEMALSDHWHGNADNFQSLNETLYSSISPFKFARIRMVCSQVWVLVRDACMRDFTVSQDFGSVRSSPFERRKVLTTSLRELYDL